MTVAFEAKGFTEKTVAFEAKGLTEMTVALVAEPAVIQTFKK